MTSKTIYASEKALPYVYRLDNPITGEFYIGYREANKTPSHIDLPKYRTSSKIIEPKFEEFNTTIIAEFFLGDDAYDHEQLSIFEEWNNPLLLNENCRYGSIGRFKTPKIRTDIHNIRISKAKRGFAIMKDFGGILIKVSVDDPRITSGELVGHTKGKVTMRDVTTGVCLQVFLDDPRIASGELVGANKGKGHPHKSKRTKEHTEKLKKARIGIPLQKSTCPHCNFTGGGGNMKRYHFDNCKKIIDEERIP